MRDGAKNPLEEVLKKIMGGIGSEGVVTQEGMAAAWEDAVGKKAAARSRVRSVKGGRVIVSVDDSSWLYELSTRKKEILKKISAKLKGRKIKEITFRIGEA